MHVEEYKGGIELALSNEFKEAVDQEKTTRVKIMLKDSLLLDKSCKEFDEMLDYANSRIGALVEEHDGEQFKSREDWNEDYLNDEMVAVVNNFSKERLDLLKSIIKKLYPDRGNEAIGEEGRTNAATNTSGRNGEMSSTKIAGGVVALVGTGLLVGGLVVAEAPIAVSILGGVTIGVGACLLFKK